MDTINAKTAPTMNNPHGVQASKLYDTQHAQAMHITLKPGESLRRHITPVDVFFYVLEGNGVVELGDEKETVSADTLVNSPAEIPHCWYNESDSPLRVLVVKAPKPSEATKLM